MYATNVGGLGERSSESSNLKNIFPTTRFYLHLSITIFIFAIDKIRNIVMPKKIRFGKTYDSMGGGVSYEADGHNISFRTMKKLIDYYNLKNVKKVAVEFYYTNSGKRHDVNIYEGEISN